MLSVSPFVRSVKNLSVCPCLPSLVCLPQSFPPSNTGTSCLLSEVALLVMCKQLNSLVVLASSYLPLFTCCNVRLTLCACIVKYTTVHLWKMFRCLQTAKYLQCENPAFSTVDMLQYYLWVWSNGLLTKGHLTTFNICCLDCVDCMFQVLSQYLVYAKWFILF